MDGLWLGSTCTFISCPLPAPGKHRPRFLTSEQQPAALAVCFPPGICTLITFLVFFFPFIGTGTSNVSSFPFLVLWLSGTFGNGWVREPSVRYLVWASCDFSPPNNFIEIKFTCCTIHFKFPHVAFWSQILPTDPNLKVDNFLSVLFELRRVEMIFFFPVRLKSYFIKILVLARYSVLETFSTASY